MAQGYLIIERHVHVGIDVCMEWLDVYLHPIGQAFRVGNTPEGLRTLKRKLAGLDVKRIVMEATAKFHRLAHRVLHAAGYTVAIVNPLRSRLFAEAAGQLAKTDRIDARMLAIMGESLDPAAMAPTPESLEALQELLHARDAAITEQTAISNRCGASELTFLKAEFGRRLKQIATHIERLNDEIERRIKADPALERRYNLLLTIPCVGPVAALTLVIALPELGTCSGKAASLLAGLAPVACESGQKIGERHIKGGRAIVRKGLYFAAVAAMRYNPQLAELYKRLRKAGKKPKVALTALMRKLVVLANTILTEDRPWSPIQP
ncbi:MAG TPA: IS110 family transposase [Beijerinckiaceae bacterium]|nr:IS110 family transposase [Beijerinckiaceae bacterium]